ncbi:class I SAM-dependent methyltransferase [Desulfovibrio ferrophilus]|uniref:Methylase involved in ubiquinone/menaquinone biosynthesis n=1 Tax=Desulfovibrio ferrophilus TaxID=241368 RepID=A0A2Z6B2V5_9BACT|nr:class I SAM-dependent methyltransferase [Desulfovibrio ferrophilus]BBD09821.1 methylase involved in ubiquinone/menaquinone biosynthesis [Desulfovibrio ferrophilus]
MYADKTRFFDAQANAPWAAADYGHEEAPKLERLFAQTGPLAGCRVLEPGCGTGRLTAELANRVGPEGHVLGMDISPEMIRLAQERLRDIPNATALTGSLEEQPLEPDGFDVALCHQVFPHIEDQPSALRCMALALRPGGSLIIHHFINSETINDHHRKAGTAVEHDLMPEPTEIRAMLRDAGFEPGVLLDDELGYLLTARLKAS